MNNNSEYDFLDLLNDDNDVENILDFEDDIEDDIEEDEELYNNDEDEISDDDIVITKVVDNKDEDEDDISINKSLNKTKSVQQTVKKKRGRPKKVNTLSAVKQQPVVFDWGMKLMSSGTEDLTITEFDKQTYVYKHITNPAGEQTGFYSCHCNDNNKKDDDGNLIWVTRNQCLSKHYIVAKVDQLVDSIKETIKVTNEDIKTSPFVLNWRGCTTKHIDCFENNIENALFNIVSGIDFEKEFKDVNSEINLSLLNSYDGRSSIYLDFIINMKFENDNGDVKSFKDYFTLSHKKNRVSHKGSISEISSNLENISEFIDDEVEVLKNYSPKNFAESVIDKIAAKMKDGNKKTYLSLWKTVGNSKKYNNLFYALLIASYCLSINYSSGQHSNLRSVIDTLVNDAHKSFTSNKNKDNK